jgi:quercetin dioxygenase-like cupin family protein
MPFFKLDQMQEELVTPKHSTAAGQLITGESIEVGVLKFKAGEGANPHSHPHEQIILVLKGVLRATVGGETADIGRGEALHVPPNVAHGVKCLEDAEVVSTKSIVGGVGHRI